MSEGGGGGSAYGGIIASANGGYGGGYAAPVCQAETFAQYNPAQPGYGLATDQVSTAPAQTAVAPADPIEQQKQYEAWAAYYAQNPTADPYSAYGGYATVMAQFMQPGAAAAYQAYAQQTQTPVDYSSGMTAAPHDQQGIPPPPPPPGANQGYSAVPPPPGM